MDSDCFSDNHVCIYTHGGAVPPHSEDVNSFEVYRRVVLYCQKKTTHLTIMKFKKIKINGCDVHRDGFRSIFTIEISENKN